MRALWLLLVCVATATAFGQPQPKINQAKLREQLRTLIKEQRGVLENTERQLKESRGTAAALWDQLSGAQAQINKVGAERDGWKAYGDDQHEKFMNAETRVAKKQATILRLYIVIGLMTLAIGAYAFLKFYLRVPFL